MSQFELLVCQIAAKRRRLNGMAERVIARDAAALTLDYALAMRALRESLERDEARLFAVRVMYTRAAIEAATNNAA